MNFKDFLIESEKIMELLEEGISYDALMKKIPSNRNRYFLKKRQDEGKSGSVLKIVDWNEKENYIRLIFHTIPTYDKVVKIVSSTATGKMYKSDHYEVIIQFDFVKEFLGTKKEFENLNFKEKVNKFRKFLKETKLRVQSNDMSFYWQGAFENLDNADATVYPFPKQKTKGKQIWSMKHKNRKYALYLSKHLVEVLSTLPFLITKIVKMIDGKSEETPNEIKKFKEKKKIDKIEKEIKIPSIKVSKSKKKNETMLEAIKRLAPVFNIVKNKKDWKLAIDTVVTGINDDKASEIEEAIQLFTGSVPYVTKIKEGTYKVQAVGYYESIGDI